MDLQEELDEATMQPTQYDNPANFMNRVFNGHGLYVGRFGGGVAILNPAQFTRVTIHPYAASCPRKRSCPAGVWEATLLP